MRVLLTGVGFLLLTLTGCDKPSHQEGTLNSYSKALDVVQAAHEILGGSQHLEALGGISLRGEGTNDLSTRFQGMKPFQKERYPITEKLAVNPKTGEVAFETDTYVNPDAREIARNFYDGQNRSLYIDLYNNFAFWNARPGLNKTSKRFSNMVPHMLLEEALIHRKSLRYLGKEEAGNHVISFHSPTYGILTLFINSGSNYLTGVEYIRDIELRGDSSVRWQFKEYKNVENIGPYPSGYSVTIQDQIFKDITYSSIQSGVNGIPVMTLPDSIDLPEMPLPPSEQEEQGSAEPSNANTLPDPLTLADNVYIFPHIRGGFHTLVVEFNDFLMAVEAPASWLELNRLPTREWEEGENSSSVGWRFLNAIEEKLADKPIRYLVLTHHHGDHIGGLRPFIDAGATIISSSITESVVKQALQNSYTYAPDQLTSQELTAEIELVNGEYAISDESMEVQLIDIGSNPHSDGMLVVYLPNEKIIYSSDLFEPINSNDFPSKARIPVMKWFVNWLDNSGLEYERVYSIHGGLRVSENHMDYIRNIDQNGNEPFQYNN